jgi:hypothetical protein
MVGHSTILETKRRVPMDFEGYCVKCREKKAVTGGEVKTAKNGRPMAQGKCPTCGTKVTVFLSAKDVAK